MKSQKINEDSTKLLLPLSPTIFGNDFDASGYTRKVELLNEGTSPIPMTLAKKVEFKCCKRCSDAVTQ